MTNDHFSILNSQVGGQNAIGAAATRGLQMKHVVSRPSLPPAPTIQSMS
jgi:hypothetical protein